MFSHYFYPVKGLTQGIVLYQAKAIHHMGPLIFFHNLHIELSSDIGIPMSGLIQIICGGQPHLQGAWVHPQVAINLAQWLSPKFAVSEK